MWTLLRTEKIWFQSPEISLIRRLAHPWRQRQKLWGEPPVLDQHLIIVSPPVADQENTEGSTGDHLQNVARQNVVWVTLFSRLATKMSGRKWMDGLFLVARVSSGSSRRYYSSIKAEFSEGVKLFLSSVYVSLVIFKVDQQQRHKQNMWCLYLCVCFLSLSLHEFLCHSTSSFRKGDRLGINKKKRIVILSSSSNSPFTPSLSLPLELDLSLSLPLQPPPPLSFLNLPLLKTKSS